MKTITLIWMSNRLNFEVQSGRQAVCNHCLSQMHNHIWSMIMLAHDYIDTRLIRKFDPTTNTIWIYSPPQPLGQFTELTADIVRALLDYDPGTGEMTWKTRPLYMFQSVRSGNSWNSKFSGKRAGVASLGYRLVTVICRIFKEHRLIWLHVHGAWPEGEIDHANHNGEDNRLANLSDGTPTDNARNASRYRTNKSGQTGVFFNKGQGKWWAYIGVAGRTKWLGSYDNFEDAVKARKAAEREHGYHPNHGKPKP